MHKIGRLSYSKHYNLSIVSKPNSDNIRSCYDEGDPEDSDDDGQNWGSSVNTI